MGQNQSPTMVIGGNFHFSKSIVDNYDVEMEIIGRMFYCKHCLKVKSKITMATALPDTECYAFRKKQQDLYS